MENKRQISDRKVKFISAIIRINQLAPNNVISRDWSLNPWYLYEALDIYGPRTKFRQLIKHYHELHDFKNIKQLITEKFNKIELAKMFLADFLNDYQTIPLDFNDEIITYLRNEEIFMIFDYYHPNKLLMSDKIIWKPLEKFGLSFDEISKTIKDFMDYNLFLECIIPIPHHIVDDTNDEIITNDVKPHRNLSHINLLNIVQPRKIITEKFDRYVAAENLFLSFFDGCKQKKLNATFYYKNGVNFLIYGGDTDYLDLSYPHLWSIFETKYKFNNDEIVELVNHLVWKHLKIKGLRPRPMHDSYSLYTDFINMRVFEEH